MKKNGVMAQSAWVSPSLPSKLRLLTLLSLLLLGACQQLPVPEPAPTVSPVESTATASPTESAASASPEVEVTCFSVEVGEGQATIRGPGTIRSVTHPLHAEPGQEIILLMTVKNVGPNPVRFCSRLYQRFGNREASAAHCFYDDHGSSEILEAGTEETFAFEFLPSKWAQGSNAYWVQACSRSSTTPSGKAGVAPMDQLEVAVEWR